MFFLIAVYISLLANHNDLTEKNLNHAAGLTIIIFFYYFVLSVLLSVVSTRLIEKHLYISFCLFAGYGILQFVDVNWLGFNFDQYVWFPDDVVPGYGSVIGEYLRSRSLLLEPGHFAWYLNTIGLLLFASGWRSFSAAKRRFLFFVYAIALTLTFSAGGIFFLIASVILSVILILTYLLITQRTPEFGVYSRRVFRNILIILVPLVSAYLILADLRAVVSDDILVKLQLESSSGTDRMDRWLKALEAFSVNPLFGIGLGSTSALEEGRGVISFYLTVLAETGIFAFLFCVLFFLATIGYGLKIRSFDLTSMGLLLSSLLASLGHFAIATNFESAWVWFLLAFVTVKVKEDMRGRATTSFG